MAANKNLKRRVRMRAAKTGESYAAALRHVRPAQRRDMMPEMNLARLGCRDCRCTVCGGNPRGGVAESELSVRQGVAHRDAGYRVSIC
jgi:hypothetical protein